MTKNFFSYFNFLIVIVIASIFIISINTHTEAKNDESGMKQFIVQMDEKSSMNLFKKNSLSSKATINRINKYESKLMKEQDNVLKQMNSQGLNFKKVQQFTRSYNGFAIKISADKSAELNDIAGVKNVYPDKRVHLDLNKSIPQIGAPDVWDKTNDEDEKVTGKGMNVAVIDTGVDYTHPDLGEGYGSEYKVVGGYDFVNNDDDPMDDYGHGTHVAGIIAADGELTGVAPDASILAYKVIDESGYGNVSDIIAGIDAAIDLENPYRADVINMSLGVDGSVPLLSAAESAVDSGVVVVVSAGNDGPDYETITSPGGADGVITVGASTSGVTVPKLAVTSPVSKDIDVNRLAFSANPTDEKQISELIDLGEGNPGDYEGVEVKGKTVLISDRKSDNFQEKAAYAEKEEASAAIFYMPPLNVSGIDLDKIMNDEPYVKGGFQNNQDSFGTGIESYGRLDSLIAVEVDSTTARELQEYLAEESVALELGGEDSTDEIPSFSSRGSAMDFKSSPDIIAPGVEIASTYPTSISKSGYARSSGTSMAAPHVAGAAALMRQYHQEWIPEEISSALAGSSVKLDSYDPLTQGAGRLDLNGAINTKLTSSTTGVSFGLADLEGETITDSQTFTLENHGEETLEVELSTDDYTSDVTADVEPSTLKISPGKSSEAKITIKADTPDEYKDFMGWIDARVDGENPDLRIPYYSAARPLMMYASPDPASGGISNMYIYSPTDSVRDPVVTLEDPDGETTKYTAEKDHDNWWRSSVEVEGQGIYKATAKTTTDDSITLIGTAYVEGSTTGNDISDNMSWKAIGPNAKGSNVQVDPHNDDLYAPSGDGYFFKSGRDDIWDEIRNLPVAAGSIVDLLFDPNDSNRMYVGVNGVSSDPTYDGKIVMSTDNGESWESLPFPDTEIKDLMIDESGKNLVAVTDDQILVHEINGEGWEQLRGEWGNSVRDTHLQGDDLYIGASDGLFVVRNISEGLDEINHIFKPDGTYKWVSKVAGDNHILLISSFSEGISASKDNGETWEVINDKLTGSMQYLEITNGKIYASKASETWMSDDYGVTWNEMNRPLSTTPITNMTDSPYSNDSILVTANGGVFETQDNGESYERNGIPGANIFDVTIAGDDSEKLIVGTAYDTYRTDLPNLKNITNSTTEWGYAQEGVHGKSAYFLETSPENENDVYKITIGMTGLFTLHKSTNAGDTWETIVTAPGGPGALFIHPANPEQIYVSYQTTIERGILKTEDGGKTWDTEETDDTILTFAGDPNNADRYWVGSGSGISVTDDGGDSYKHLQDHATSKIIVNPEEPDHLVYGGRDFHYSQDGGKTVKEGEYNELSIFIRDILFSPDKSGTLYATTQSFAENDLVKGGRGVLRSTDGGKTWHTFSKGLNNRDTLSLAITNDAKHLYVGTSGGSAYGMDLPLLGDINGDGVIDIHDVLRAVAHYGTDNEDADLNGDGIVDEKDMRILEYNFLKVEPDAKGNVKPQEKVGSKGLNDLLKAVGIDPIS